eukprot:3341279-Pleurochrysis_carterae.AAC.4
MSSVPLFSRSICAMPWRCNAELYNEMRLEPSFWRSMPAPRVLFFERDRRRVLPPSLLPNLS